jgi:muramoyltetrapeptide carboxypeptidase
LWGVAEYLVTLQIDNRNDMFDASEIIYPAPLNVGDEIAIVSPAGPIASEKVLGAKSVLEGQGWRVRIMEHALGKAGIYAGTDAERFDDLSRAFTDTGVKAILCSRGGYGMVHLVQRLEEIDVRANAKWVIGFSDISALHAVMATNGVASLHASMAKQIMLGADDADNATLFAMLRGERPSFTFNAHSLDRQGEAEGTLLGGNMAVLSGLVNTRYDILLRDKILFIEDIAEPIYKIERMLYQLRLSGVLPNLRGLIVGQFTEYRSDASYQDMYHMIADMVAPYSYPVAFNAPIGHVDHNIPVIESAHITLKVTNTGNNHIIYQQQ